MNRNERQIRSVPAAFETREDNGDMVISGYFAVFNSDYEIWPGATESIDAHAFDGGLSDDIRALILQNPAHLPNPFRAVQTSQESMNLTHKRIPATGRRHSQLHDLMAVLCPHSRHLIDNRLLSRVLSIVIMNQ